MRLVKREEVLDETRPPLLDREKYFELAKERGLVSTDGEFFLMGAGMFLNPNVGGWSNYYFTSEEGAKNYYDLFFSNSSYDVVLCRGGKHLN